MDIIEYWKKLGQSERIELAERVSGDTGMIRSDVVMTWKNPPHAIYMHLKNHPEEMIKIEQQDARSISILFERVYNNVIKNIPAIFRANYFINMIANAINENPNVKIDFKKIEREINDGLSPYDTNLFVGIESISHLFEIRTNAIAAELGFGIWQEHTCKDCGNDFYMSHSEVKFYAKKELNIPVRCSSCREKRKSQK